MKSQNIPELRVGLELYEQKDFTTKSKYELCKGWAENYLSFNYKMASDIYTKRDCAKYFIIHLSYCKLIDKSEIESLNDEYNFFKQMQMRTTIRKGKVERLVTWKSKPDEIMSFMSGLFHLIDHYCLTLCGYKKEYHLIPNNI